MENLNTPRFLHYISFMNYVTDLTPVVLWVYIYSSEGSFEREDDVDIGHVMSPFVLSKYTCFLF